MLTSSDDEVNTQDGFCLTFHEKKKNSFLNQLYKEKEMKGCIKSAQWEIEPSAPAASLPCSTRPHLSSTRFKSCEQIAATPSLLHITFHR